MTETLNDEMLMELLASGKKIAAGILYDRNYKKVFGYFDRMTKDSDVNRDEYSFHFGFYRLYNSGNASHENRFVNSNR